MPKKKEENKLSEAIAKIEKQFGKNLVVNLDSNEVANVERVSTGIFSLDNALGGGLPRGRIIEIFGQNSSGKSSLCLLLTKQFQDLGEEVVYLDAEQSFDKSYAKLNGVNIQTLTFAQPEYTEQLFAVLESFIESGKVGLIIVDSIASVPPKAELNGEAGDSHMGLQARLVSQAMRRLVSKIKTSKTCVIFINQMRKNIGVMFGSPWTTTSGEALKFYSTIRMELIRMKSIKKGDEVIATEIKAKIKKNKVAPPYKEAVFEIHWDSGICRVSDIINMALENSIIKKKAAWFSYNDQQFQGLENLRQSLKTDEKLFNSIKQEVLDILEAQKA